MPPPQLQVTMFDTCCTTCVRPLRSFLSITQKCMYYADLQVLRRFMVITQICEHYAELQGLRRFNRITQRRVAPAPLRQLLRPAHSRLMRVPLALAAAAARPLLRLPHPARRRCGTCRVFDLINRCFFSYQRITGTTRMVRAAAKEFNHIHVRASLRRVCASSS